MSCYQSCGMQPIAWSPEAQTSSLPSPDADCAIIDVISGKVGTVCIQIQHFLINN